MNLTAYYDTSAIRFYFYSFDSRVSADFSVEKHGYLVMRRSAEASCPTYVPSNAACSAISVAAITNEVDTGVSGRPWEFTGTINVPIGSETYDDWSLLIRFSQRVQNFDATFDSFRDRDNEHEPIQHRWMLGPFLNELEELFHLAFV